MSRIITELEKSGGKATEPKRDVVVGLGDFEAAVEKFVPSVTSEDLDYYRGVKESIEAK